MLPNYYDDEINALTNPNIKYKIKVFRINSNELESNTTKILTNIAIDLIDKGRPVIIYTHNYNEGKDAYHAVVAHDYNKYNQLLCHFGWVRFAYKETA